jgi:hypothetical protein
MDESVGRGTHARAEAGVAERRLRDTQVVAPTGQGIQVQHLWPETCEVVLQEPPGGVEGNVGGGRGEREASTCDAN